MNTPELLAPAGSMDGVRAAVQNGANAIYMGYGTFNARRGAKNFTKEEIADAIAYCHARGVHTHIAMNILLFDREIPQALEDAQFLQSVGADALIVQDLGLARLLRHHMPDMPLHASTQMTIHTLDGAKLAKELGFTRVVLSRECSFAQIQHITQHAGIETEIFVHGALCMCYSGQCYLSSLIGQRSGNRGTCAQPCRLPYQYDGGGKAGTPLSLKDVSLSQWLMDISRAGVASLKIEGRMKRPEYTASVTKIYADLLKEQRKPTKAEQSALAKIFSRDGFTDGYFTGKVDASMFGTKSTEQSGEMQALFKSVASTFAEGKEAPRVGVAISCLIDETGISLNLYDGQTDGVTVLDAQPVEPAQTRATTRDEVETALAKLGGTPFYPLSMHCQMADGLRVPVSRLNALRRQAVEKLLKQRMQVKPRPWVGKSQDVPSLATDFAGYTASVQTLAQAQALLELSTFKRIDLPLSELFAYADVIPSLLQTNTEMIATLPRVWHDQEQGKIEHQLTTVRQAGVQTVFLGNVGHIPLVRKYQMHMLGDFGLNIVNAHALEAVRNLGLAMQTLSFELRLEQVRDMKKPLATELILYGHLPLMLFENCAIRRKTGKCTCHAAPCCLTDRKGEHFPLLPAFGCRNVLLASKPLYVPVAQVEHLGVQASRLYFTTESPEDCVRIAKDIQTGNDAWLLENSTRGLYRRGVL